MSLQYSVPVRNARLDSLETQAGSSPKLRFYTGAPPANCAAAATGSLLAELTLPADWLGDSANGVKSLAGAWTGTASAGGTIGHFRLYDSAGTTCHMQGTCGQASGDMPFDNNVVVLGQTIQVSSAVFTAAGA